MSPLLFCFLLGIISNVTGLSDVHKACVTQNNATLSNDNLLGVWYEIYRFTLFGNPLPSVACMQQNFTRPTSEEIQIYRDKYDSPGLPYSFDDNPILRKRDRFSGMIMGRNMAKFYVLSPGSVIHLSGGYDVFAYKHLNDQFIMFSDCAMRGNMRLLLTRNKDATVEEMEKLIVDTPELRRLAKQRFCA